MNMSNPTGNEKYQVARKNSPIKKLMKKWREMERCPCFYESNHLLKLCVYLEYEHTAFWGRDLDPFDERPPAEQPMAGVYSNICCNLMSFNHFLRGMITKHIMQVDDLNGCTNHMLRFLCSVLHCYDSNILLSTFNRVSKDLFYDKMFELAVKTDAPGYVYCTFILGYISKEDEQLMFRRKSQYVQLIGLTVERIRSLNSRFQGELVNCPPPTTGSCIDDESNLNLYNLPMTNLFGEWTLAPPMKETMQARLLIDFLRHMAKFVPMIPSMYSEEILIQLSSWLCFNRHEDIRLIFDALRLLLQLLRRGVIYTEYIDPIKWVNLLVNVPRPSVAANVVSLCLHRLLCHEDFLKEVVLLPKEKLVHLINVVLWVIKTCHPSAQSYAMLCVRCFARMPLTLRIFEELKGPRCILNSLAIQMEILGKSCNDEEILKETMYFILLKTTLKTVKIYLEQSLVNWSMSLESVDMAGLFPFPTETKSPFSQAALKAIPLAIKLQTWKHPYLADKRSVIKILFSDRGFFSSTRSIFKEFKTTLDILSLLSVSNEFVLDFLNWVDRCTETSLSRILDGIDCFGRETYHISALRSVLLYLSVLFCRPLEHIVTSASPSSSTRKRRYNEIVQLSRNVSTIEKDNSPVFIESIFSMPYRGGNSVKLDASTEDLQTTLWNLTQGREVIASLLNVLDMTLSPDYDLSESIWICTWICHVLSGLSRSKELFYMIRNFSIFKKGILESRLFEDFIPAKMREYAEVCSIVRSLVDDLGVQRSRDIKNAREILKKPSNILHYLTKREQESSPRSYNSRMVQRCVRHGLNLRVAFCESDALSNDKFTEHFCFAKDLDEGLFIATAMGKISFIDLGGSQTSFNLGEVFYNPNNMENTKDGRSLIVSFDYDELYYNKLFDVENRANSPSKMKKRHEYSFAGYTEFSKTNDNKFVVTQNPIVKVVDVEMDVSLFECHNENFATGFEYRDIYRATFSYDDNLILSYATLWDIRCPSREVPVHRASIHRFKYLGNARPGIFHHNGHDVIIDNTVWDMRTYRLVQDIPRVSSSTITFVNDGDLFYSYNSRAIECYNSRDYSRVMSLGTTNDIKALAVHPKGFYVACIVDEVNSTTHCDIFNVCCNWTSTSGLGFEYDHGEAGASLYQLDVSRIITDVAYEAAMDSASDTDEISCYGDIGVESVGYASSSNIEFS